MHCATNIGGCVRLGVDVNGSQVGEKYIVSNIGYDEYVITFNANKGDLIKIWYYADDVSGWATIDDVSLE